MLPNPFTRLRRVYCQKTALNKRSDSLEGYFPPLQHLTLRITLLSVVASRFALDARPRPGMIASSAGGGLARSHANRKATHGTPTHAIFSLSATSPIGGLGGCRTERKGAKAIEVADLFRGGVIKHYIRYKKGKK